MPSNSAGLHSTRLNDELVVFVSYEYLVPELVLYSGTSTDLTRYLLLIYRSTMTPQLLQAGDQRNRIYWSRQQSGDL